MSFSRTTRIGIAAVALSVVGLVATAGPALAAAPPDPGTPDIAPTLSSDRDSDDAPTPAEEGPEPDDADRYGKDDLTPAGAPVGGTVESVKGAPKRIVPSGEGGPSY